MKHKLLVIDDERYFLTLLDKVFTRAGYMVTTVSESVTAVDAARAVRPDLILMDIMMPGMNGKQIKEAMNADPQLASIPVIFLTGMDTVDEKIDGLRLGAEDYITKPCDLRELMARVEAVLNRHRVYEESAIVDPLTGLYSLQFLKKEASILCRMAKRYNKIFALALVTIENLMEIADAGGKEAIEAATREAAAIMTDTLRRSDIVARYGDGFAVILPEINEEQAQRAFERFGARLREQEGKRPQGSGPMALLAVSIALCTAETADEEELFRAAASGRNGKKI